MILNLIRRMLYGIYGYDELGKTLMIISLLLAALWTITSWDVLAGIILVLMAICYFRIFSHNHVQRRQENTRFLSITANFRKSISNAVYRLKDRKTHRYFKCKCCKSYLRVPKGKGKIKVHCPNCGNEFIKKT